MNWLICILSVILILDNLIGEMMERYHRQKVAVNTGTENGNAGNMPVFSRESYFSGMAENTQQDSAAYRMLTLHGKRTNGTEIKRKRLPVEKKTYNYRNTEKTFFPVALVKKFHDLLTGAERERIGGDAMRYYGKTIETRM